MWVLKPSLEAASDSMRPSWPPPRIPMTEPGGRMRRSGSGIGARLGGDGSGLLVAEVPERERNGRPAEGQHLGRQQGGVDGSGLADRQRADRDAGRHLNN